MPRFLSYVIVFILATVCCACGTVSNSKMKIETKPPFTYQVELAIHYHGQSEKKGEINYSQFVIAFDEFPWSEQIEMANQLGRVSPTLTVDDNMKNEALWVSAFGDGKSNTFLIGHIYPKEIRGWFGFGQPRMRKWIEIYSVQDQRIVKDCFKLFFAGDISGLKTQYSKLEKFDEMEAQIQD